MPANELPETEHFEFFERLRDRRTLEAVRDTVEGMEISEALHLLNITRAMDALMEAIAAPAGVETDVDLDDLFSQLAEHAAATALAIHDREDD